jgi:carnosine N-methyltransferase
MNFTSLTRFLADIEPESSPSHSHEHGHDGDDHSHSHGHGGRHTHSHGSSDHGINEGDMDKVRSTLKQLVRDWSEEVSDEPLLNQGQMQIPRREKGSVRRATPPWSML